jgi:hypothetical protein
VTWEQRGDQAIDDFHHGGLRRQFRRRLVAIAGVVRPGAQISQFGQDPRQVWVMTCALAALEPRVHARTHPKEGAHGLGSGAGRWVEILEGRSGGCDPA